MDSIQLINHLNTIVHIEPYGKFVIRSGHEPKVVGQRILFYAWIIKAPAGYKKSLSLTVSDYCDREAIISKLIKIIKDSGKGESYFINGIVRNGAVPTSAVVKR